MADKQLLLKKSADESLFADDDPLAELARIVSFEPATETQPRPTVARREPEFDLEEELLKEFEQFEAQGHVPDVATPAELPASWSSEALSRPEGDSGSAEAIAAEHVPLEAPITRQHVDELPSLELVEEPLISAAPVIVDPVRPDSHPVFDLEDEILREFAAFDAGLMSASAKDAPLEPMAAPDGSADLVDQLIAELGPSIENESHYEAPAFHAPVSEAPVAAERHEELAEETAIIAHEIGSGSAAEAEHASPDTSAWSDVDSAFHSHEAQVADEAAEPVHDIDFSAEQAWEAEFAGLAHDDVPVTETSYAAPDDAGAAPVPSSHVEVGPEPVAFAPAGDTGKTSAFDPLLDDIDRFDVPRTTQWSRSTPVAFDRKPEVRMPADDQPIMPAPVVADRLPGAAAIATDAVEIPSPAVEAIESSFAEIGDVAGEPDALDAFDDGAFELDLSEIELDLLEMEALGDTVAHDEPLETSPALMTAMANEVVEPAAGRMASTPAEPVAARREETPVAPALREAKPAADYASLPFDPTQVNSEEDPVEAIGEVDVPEVVHDHGPQPAPVQADYDIDIDAEMAHLFNRPAPAALARTNPAVGASYAAQPKPAQPAPQIQATDLDDFERALEEDFRKSMTENRSAAGPDRVALSPNGYPIDQLEGSSSRKLLLLAASVAAIVLVGGAGVYAFWGGESGIMQTSSEPKIILADKDPVKEVPKDRGGQQVPNQDKAVYERVSGEATDQQKQERLVSSSEEPVDVVQRTLMPENLPMDDEDGASAASDETADPRLPPDGTQDANVSTSEKVTNGVAPRKVRTMVVRADGTLVPREDLPADEQVVAKPELKERSVDVASADATVPERLTANASVDDSIASQINQAEVADPVEKSSSADVAKEQTGSTAETASAAGTVGNTEIKPSVSDETASATDTDAQSAAASAAVVDENAPIPVSRPVEEPAAVVEKAAPVEKPAVEEQQVASAESVSKPETATALPAGSYVIQIASLPSEAEAQTSYNRLSAKFAEVIGGRGVDIKRADIKNKGTYYRVRIPAGSRQEAAALCDRYKQAGGSCLVSR